MPSTNSDFDRNLEHSLVDGSSAVRPSLFRPRDSDNLDFLAINVPSTYQQGVIPDGEVPPWGMLRVVVSARETHGFNAGILDAHALKLQPTEIKTQIMKSQASLVGLNPTSVNVPEAKKVAEICDELGVPYLLGGIHATLDPATALRDFKNAAFLIRGDGEVAVSEVLSAALRGGSMNTSGVYSRDQAFDRTSGYAPKVRPELIPIIRQNVYVANPLYVYSDQVNGSMRLLEEASLYITTGCPFECTFCASPIMVNRAGDVPYLRPPIKRMVDEIELAVQHVGANAIHFLDDMPFINGDNIREFYSGLIAREMIGGFVWRGLTRASVIARDDFDHNVMAMMKETGCWKIAIGIESGSEEILRRIKKKITKEQVTLAVQKLVSYGINVKGFFIMGFPGETRAQIEATAEYVLELKQLGLTEASIYQFKPYPGTQEYHWLAEVRPEVLPHLRYLKRTELQMDEPITGEVGTDVWLPDDIRIAQLRSGEVRDVVVRTLDNFYADIKLPKSSDFMVEQGHLDPTYISSNHVAFST